MKQIFDTCSMNLGQLICTRYILVYSNRRIVHLYLLPLWPRIRLAVRPLGRLAVRHPETRGPWSTRRGPGHPWAPRPRRPGVRPWLLGVGRALTCGPGGRGPPSVAARGAPQAAQASEEAGGGEAVGIAMIYELLKRTSKA